MKLSCSISRRRYRAQTGGKAIIEILYYRNIVSAKHCAVAAGLGRIGRNTLLITPEYGNMVWLCAVLLDTAFVPDEMHVGDPCPKGCSLCIDNCRVHALGEPEMKQTVCHTYAFGGDWKIKCNKC